jgi:uncharacterized protein (TIGR02246 family)
MQNDQDVIAGVLKAYEAALNASDVARVEALYTADGVFMPAGFPTAEGRDAVRASYTGIFGMIRLNVRFAIDEISVEGDLAFARTRSVGTVTVLGTDTGTAAPEENRELFVLRRMGEGWKIARYLFNKPSQS